MLNSDEYCLTFTILYAIMCTLMVNSVYQNKKGDDGMKIFFIIIPVLIIAGIIWTVRRNCVKKRFGIINEKVTVETLRKYRKR